MPDPVKVVIETRRIHDQFYRLLIANGRIEEAYLASEFPFRYMLRARRTLERALLRGSRGALCREAAE